MVRCSVLPMVALAVVLVIQSSATANDIEKMRGNWVVVAIQVDGMVAQPPQQTRITFDGAAAVSQTGNQPAQQSQVAINAAAQPPQVDITPVTQGAPKMSGIYQFQEDGTLVICTSMGDQPRPQQWKTEKDDGIVMLFLRPAQ